MRESSFLQTRLIPILTHFALPLSPPLSLLIAFRAAQPPASRAGGTVCRTVPTYATVGVSQSVVSRPRAAETSTDTQVIRLVQSHDIKMSLLYRVIVPMLPCLMRAVLANNCSISSYQYGAALSCSIFKRYNVCSYSKMPGHTEQAMIKRATFGMGCFWAGDSLFGALPGVIRTCVGYAGGTKKSPVYRDMYFSLTMTH